MKRVNVSSNAPKPLDLCTLLSVRPAGGFTLLELLISLTLMGLVSLGVYSALGFGANALERGTSRSIENQRVRAALALIVRKLKSAYPLMLPVDGERLVYFFGDEEELRFIASADRPEIGGLEKVSYFIKEEDGQRGLWMRISAPTLPADLVEEREGSLSLEAEVLSDVDELVWEYFGQRQTEDEEAWHESWNGEEEPKLPQAVRLSWRALSPAQGGMGGAPNAWQIEVPIQVQEPVSELRRTPQNRGRNRSRR